jgi:RNA polymerase sigma factor for flagellar operon FliA
MRAERRQPAIPDAAEAAAWQAWRRGRAPEARELLVRRHVHLVRYMARRLVRTVPLSVELDDLIGAGGSQLLIDL